MYLYSVLIDSDTTRCNALTLYQYYDDDGNSNKCNLYCLHPVVLYSEIGILISYLHNSNFIV
jgi:hypothetical protein